MNLSETIDHIRPCIVQVCGIATDLSEDLRRRVNSPFIRWVFGTGFFINVEAYIVTAGHVIQKGREILDSINAGLKNMHVGIGLPNSENFISNFVMVDFDEVDESAETDLALLRLRRNPFAGEVRSGVRIGEHDIPLLVGVPAISTIAPREGQQIGISGYPLQQNALVTNSGCVSSIWSRPNYLADIEINSGNSGAPVFVVDDASIIGVCVASEGTAIWREGGEPARILDHGLYYSSGLTQFVPAGSLMDLLNQNEVSYITVESDQTSTEG